MPFVLQMTSFHISLSPLLFYPPLPSLQQAAQPRGCIHKYFGYCIAKRLNALMGKFSTKSALFPGYISTFTVSSQALNMAIVEHRTSPVEAGTRTLARSHRVCPTALSKPCHEMFNAALILLAQPEPMLFMLALELRCHLDTGEDWMLG